MKKLRYFLTHYPLSVVCIALIWYLSIWFMPPEKLFLNNVAFIDKWTHFVMYGGFCSVIWFEYLRRHRQVDGRKLFLLAWLAPVLMSGLLELVQAYCTTNRAGEWLDFAANTTGVTIGNLIGLAMRKLKIVPLAAMLLLPMPSYGWHSVLNEQIKGLQVVLNDDFEALPVLTLGSNDVLTIGFDELSHNYHRYVYRLEPCNPDWTPVEGLFESDWLAGFNGQPIDDYENSINTTVLYTHYQMRFPNRDCRPKISGNYRLWITDDETGDDAVCVELRVVQPLMNVGLGVTTNTDLELNGRYQQVAMTVNYNSVRVTRPDEQIQTIVMQNGREDNMKVNVKPDYITTQGLKWEHNKKLIFDAGNEYHKFEVLDPTHPTMGLASTRWDEDTRTWHAVPVPLVEQRSYIYDEDANGAFLQRNSDNYEINRTSDYVYVHYSLTPVREYTDANIIIDGRWTTEDIDNYVMSYDQETATYNAVVMQKLGYYNYQLRLLDYDGTTHPLPEEGSFFQTENDYQAFVYYKGTGERAWRLLAFQQITFR